MTSLCEGGHHRHVEGRVGRRECSVSPDSQTSSRRNSSVSNRCSSRSVRRPAASSAALDSREERSSAMWPGAAQANLCCITPASSLVAVT
jgi:hypothetical protein